MKLRTTLAELTQVTCLAGLSLVVMFVNGRTCRAKLQFIAFEKSCSTCSMHALTALNSLRMSGASAAHKNHDQGICIISRAVSHQCSFEPPQQPQLSCPGTNAEEAIWSNACTASSHSCCRTMLPAEPYMDCKHGVVKHLVPSWCHECSYRMPCCFIMSWTPLLLHGDLQIHLHT